MSRADAILPTVAPPIAGRIVPAGRAPKPDAPPEGLSPLDPRWVLASGVGEAMEGTMLSGEARERLSRVGRVLGLTPFETTLVMTIVQDQARRGGGLRESAGALALVPRSSAERGGRRGWGWVAGWTAATLAAELAVVGWLWSVWG